jgi:hypothetical protein
MELASALMLKHNIQENEIDTGDKPKVKRGDWLDFDVKWKSWVTHAVDKLYSVRGVQMGDKIQFVGRLDNIDAAEQTYVAVCNQIERLYKTSLPRGMSQQDRAQFRRDFKMSCAIRVNARATEIVQNLMKDEIAQQATGSTALVVIEARKQLDQEIDVFFHEIGVRSRKARPTRVNVSRGSIEGFRAGDKVQLNRSVR